MFKGVISDEDFKRNKDKLREELDGIQDSIDNLERSRNIKIDVVQEVLKLTRNVQGSYKQADDQLKRQYLSLFWEKFEVDGNKIVRAVPTRIFKALQDDYKISLEAQKPVLERQASDFVGVYHPNSQPTDTSKVQLANGWGG